MIIDNDNKTVEVCAKRNTRNRKRVNGDSNTESDENDSQNFTDSTWKRTHSSSVPPNINEEGYTLAESKSISSTNTTNTPQTSSQNSPNSKVKLQAPSAPKSIHQKLKPQQSLDMDKINQFINENSVVEQSDDTHFKSAGIAFSSPVSPKSQREQQAKEIDKTNCITEKIDPDEKLKKQTSVDQTEVVLRSRSQVNSGSSTSKDSSREKEKRRSIDQIGLFGRRSSNNSKNRNSTHDSTVSSSIKSSKPSRKNTKNTTNFMSCNDMNATVGSIVSGATTPICNNQKPKEPQTSHTTLNTAQPLQSTTNTSSSIKSKGFSFKFSNFGSKSSSFNITSDNSSKNNSPTDSEKINPAIIRQRSDDPGTIVHSSGLTQSKSLYIRKKDYRNKPTTLIIDDNNNPKGNGLDAQTNEQSIGVGFDSINKRSVSGDSCLLKPGNKPNTIMHQSKSSGNLVNECINEYEDNQDGDGRGQNTSNEIPDELPPSNRTSHKNNGSIRTPTDRPSSILDGVPVRENDPDYISELSVPRNINNNHHIDRTSLNSGSLYQITQHDQHSLRSSSLRVHSNNKRSSNLSNFSSSQYSHSKGGALSVKSKSEDHNKMALLDNGQYSRLSKVLAWGFVNSVVSFIQWNALMLFSQNQ